MKNILIALSLVILPVGTSVEVCALEMAANGCCKVCKKGKACGDSCIARDRTCTKGKGCACNG